MKPSTNYVGIVGIIEQLAPVQNECCNQNITLRTMNGIVRFILSPGTYVADNTPLRTGMRITAFYDTNQPVPLIYPPQYQAVFIVRTEPAENIVVSYFDRDLLSQQHQLKLNIDNTTRISTANGQRYTCNLGENLLMVFYSASTRSIPAQTTPERIIVFC